jgi:Kef-type K+ transport system membrane component KefB
VTFLAQLVLLMLVGRLLGELMIRFGQPSVMGMLLGGVTGGVNLRIDGGACAGEDKGAVEAPWIV